MNDTLILYCRIVANVLGVTGLVVCGTAGVMRLLGGFHVLGFETMTVFVAGVGALVSACFVKLWLLERHLSQ